VQNNKEFRRLEHGEQRQAAAAAATTTTTATTKTNKRHRSNDRAKTSNLSNGER
jgi:hypothetical protein